jgi:hypothetical protein
MQAILTPAILDYLIEQGYRYCLSKTQGINGEGTSVIITLTPVVHRPRLEKLPIDYDTYFNIQREPRQMACGIDETEIFVELNETMRLQYHLLYG